MVDDGKSMRTSLKILIRGTLFMDFIWSIYFTDGERKKGNPLIAAA
jgi:hypothetical protein